MPRQDVLRVEAEVWGLKRGRPVSLKGGFLGGGCQATSDLSPTFTMASESIQTPLLSTRFIVFSSSIRKHTHTLLHIEGI